MVSPDRMEDELTVVDPVALTKDLEGRRFPYQRVAGLDRMVHGDCNENDRNPVVDGKLTIAPANCSRAASARLRPSLVRD